MTGVPRVYEKLHARIMEKGAAASAASAAIFRGRVGAGARKRGRALLRGRPAGALDSAAGAARRSAGVRQDPRRRSAAGCATSSRAARRSAPTSRSSSARIGLPIVEGYGLTETAPILTVNPPGAPRVGTVGTSLPGVELRIADDGEILARGPNLMTGYYNKPEATADVLQDGWFHTGDIGTIDEDGYLSITDRKKDLLVTSGGKKIAPQPIEATLKRSPLVAEAVVLGERRKFAAGADRAGLRRARAAAAGARPPAGARATSSSTRADVVALYQEIVDALNRELSQFERIKRIALLPAEFTIESGELTPTLKVKRKVVEQRWRDRGGQCRACLGRTSRHQERTRTSIA